MTGRLLLANARLTPSGARGAVADSVLVQNGRIVALGPYAALRDRADNATQVIDAEGGVALPAFHDAHLHLLSYARQSQRLDCSRFDSLSALRVGLARQAAMTPDGGWVRGFGYDEQHMRDALRHPDRWDLDSATPDRPTRLQHRSQHLDVLNTAALRATGLLDSPRPEIERDPLTGQPTGRLYHSAELLRHASPSPEADDLARDVRAATQRLLMWGVTSVQDASVTNGLSEWHAFHRLARAGALGVRTFVCPGQEHWREVCASEIAATDAVRLGPVKFMLIESRLDQHGLDDLRSVVSQVHAAGRAVALHAVSEAEVAVALDILTRARPRRGAGPPDRIEHAASVPTDLLPDLAAARVMVVGQPASIVNRGDRYLQEHGPDTQPWLHRAATFTRAGVPYAVGSDAPVGEPPPGLALYALTHRRTAGGKVFGRSERLAMSAARQALTLGPARAVGAEHGLGRLVPGAVADIVVLDTDAATGASLAAARRAARLTIKDGVVVWRRSSLAAQTDERSG